MGDDYDARRAAKDWILFVVGIGIIIVMTAAWLLRGTDPNPYLGGIALMCVGFGNMLLERGGK